MDDIYALVCGCDYSGNWKVYQSCNDSDGCYAAAGRLPSRAERARRNAKRFYDILVNVYNIKKRNIKTLYNNQVTRRNLINELDNFSKKLSKPNTTGIIYFAGHGTGTRDRNSDEKDGKDENWQTYDRRCVVDDEITSILARTHKDANLTVISDCCHSGTVLDFIEKDQNQYNDRKWLSIGSALDNQSALQSGDGSVCSYQLFKILKENPGISIKKLKFELIKNMRESFIGTMQTCVINISNKNLFDKKVFTFEDDFIVTEVDDVLLMK